MAAVNKLGTTSTQPGKTPATLPPINGNKVVADFAKDKLAKNPTPTTSTSFFSRNATALKVGAGALAVGAVIGGLVAKFGAEAVAAKTALVYLSAVHPVLYMLVTALGNTSLFALQNVVIPALLPMLTHAAVAAIVAYIVYYVVSKAVSALAEKGQSLFGTLTGKGIGNLISQSFESLLGFDSTQVEKDESSDKEKIYQTSANSPKREMGFCEVSARFASVVFLGVDVIELAGAAAQQSRVQKDIDPASVDSSDESLSLLYSLVNRVVNYAINDESFDTAGLIIGQDYYNARETDRTAELVAPSAKAFDEDTVTVIQDKTMSPTADKAASVFVDILGFALSVI